MPTPTRQQLSRSIGHRLTDRNLDSLTPAERVVALAVMAAIALAMLVVTMSILGTGPLDRPLTRRSRAVTGVVLYGALMMSLGVLAGAVRGSKEQGILANLSRSGVRLLPTAGLVLVAFSILAMNEDQRTSPRPEWALIRTVVWAALGVACVYVLRPTPRSSPGFIDADRARRVIVPAILWIMVLGVTKAMGVYAMGISALLMLPVVVLALVGVAVAIGVTVSAAVAALEGTRRRGQALAQYVGRNTPLIFYIVLAKLIALAAVWAIYRVLRPDERVIVPTQPTILMAAIAAMVAIVLFVVNSRVRLLAADHTQVARYAGLLVGGALGVGLGVVVTIAMMATIVTVRWASIIGVAVLIAFGLLHALVQNRTLIILGYPVAVALGVTIATVLGNGRRIGKPVVDPASESTMQLLTAFAALVGVLVFIAAAVSIVVLAISRRRFGWLTYVITVVIWNVIVSCWNSVAPVEFMNFDLALTLMLGVAGVLLVLGIQRVIDGYEIAVGVVVTFLLIEGPMLMDLLPERLALLPVLLAVVGPGFAILWTESAGLRDAYRRRHAMVRLATTSLVYCGIAAVFWQIEFDMSDYLDRISQFALSVLSIPLLLILVAAHQPTRRQR